MAVYYSDYLQLDKVLDAQAPLSAAQGTPAHDEMLFIIIHQVYELWFKQIQHELDDVLDIFSKDYVDEKQIGIAISRLRRITEIQKVLVDQLNVLETMTSLDFLEFRHLLSPASGFQSVQFREIENKLGVIPEQRLRYDKRPYSEHVTPEDQQPIKASEQNPSLFQLVERWLERTPYVSVQGFDFWQTYRQAVEQYLQADRETILDNPNLTAEEKTKHLDAVDTNVEHFAALFDESKHLELIQNNRWRLSHKATQAALLIHLYRDEPILHLPFGLLTVLIDMDELLTSWRYRHALMVHRMIGAKIGTGGSVGHQYLRATVDKHKIFTDLFNLSTFLIPRSALPALPEEVQQKLGFYPAQPTPPTNPS
jgi:tryptophan 2,3-dioxygenase